MVVVYRQGSRLELSAATGRLLAHDQFAVFFVYRDGLAGGDVATEQALGQHGLHRVLDIAAQGPGAVLGVVGGIHNGGLSLVRQAAGNTVCWT